MQKTVNPGQADKKKKEKRKKKSIPWKITSEKRGLF